MLARPFIEAFRKLFCDRRPLCGAPHRKNVHRLFANFIEKLDEAANDVKWTEKAISIFRVGQRVRSE